MELKEIKEILRDKLGEAMNKKKKKLKCPGSKIRSKGRGQGLGIGAGKGPIGRHGGKNKRGRQ